MYRFIPPVAVYVCWLFCLFYLVYAIAWLSSDFVLWLAYLIGLSKVIKVGGKQKPYEMRQAGISLAASPLANSLAGFAMEGIWRLCRSPAHESRQLRRLHFVFPVDCFKTSCLMFVDTERHRQNLRWYIPLLRSRKWYQKFVFGYIKSRSHIYQMYFVLRSRSSSLLHKERGVMVSGTIWTLGILIPRLILLNFKFSSGSEFLRHLKPRLNQ